MWRILSKTQEDEPKGRFYQDETLVETAKLITDLMKKGTELSNDVKPSKKASFDLVRKHLILKGFLDRINKHIESHNNNPSQSTLETSADLLLEVSDLLNNHFNELNYFRSYTKSVANKLRSYGSYALGFGTAAIVTSSTLGFGLLGFIGSRYLDVQSETMLGYDMEKTDTVEKLILLMNNLVKVVGFHLSEPGQSVKAKKLANRAIKSLQEKHDDDNHRGEKQTEIEEAILAITDDIDGYLEFMEAKFPKEDGNQYLYCPISHAIMTNPAMLGVTGHTFQKEQLVLALNEHSDRDPLTNQLISNNTISTNYSIKDVILGHIEKVKAPYLAQQEEALDGGGEEQIDVEHRDSLMAPPSCP